MTGGHGHVTPRPGGSPARCGGPRRCRECADELAALVTIPDQLVVEGGPGALKVVQADQFIRIPLALILSAPSSVFSLLDDMICILGQVHYRITGWDAASNSLTCNRIHTVMETIRGDATPEEIRADLAHRAAALQQEARDAFALMREPTDRVRLDPAVAFDMLHRIPDQRHADRLVVEARNALGEAATFDDVAISAAARHILSRLPRRGARLLADLRAELGGDPFLTQEEILRAAVARAIEQKIPLFPHTPLYDQPDADLSQSPRPADCDAYADLSDVKAPANVLIPEDWCARSFEVNEEIRVGDEHGRRAAAIVLGWSADSTATVVGPYLRITSTDKDLT
uniref:hypothetical protein n=1 Tax=Streptosporangium sp. CA-235898 TaxID=3240073 RepID=UPI003F49A58B